jgi:hypothetical protein
MSVLAGFHGNAVTSKYRRIPFHPSVGVVQPTFPNMEAMASALPTSDRSLAVQQVVACGSCGKSNAIGLAVCNGCSTSLAGAPVKETDNLFVGFAHGVGRATAGFPLSMSMRSSSRGHLAFDDLMQMGVFHINVIPTRVVVQDWRELLRKPKLGSQLVRRLLREAVSAAVKDLGEPASVIRASYISGFNYPPSQSQLHLQFAVTPLFPWQRVGLDNGVHCTARRFFPVEFVLALLESGYRLPDPKASTLPEVDVLLDDVLRKVRLDYDEFLATALRRYKQVNDERVTRWWDRTDFAYRVSPDADLVRDAATGADVTSTAPTLPDILKADKKSMPNYGRPDDGSAVRGVYYATPVTPGQMRPFADVATIRDIFPDDD